MSVEEGPLTIDGYEVREGDAVKARMGLIFKPLNENEDIAVAKGSILIYLGKRPKSWAENNYVFLCKGKTMMNFRANKSSDWSGLLQAIKMSR